MKNKLILMTVLIFALSCKAQHPPIVQQPVPLEDYIDYQNNNIPIPDNIYFKDVNHVLDKYLGTWVGSYGNKTYEIQVVEATRQSNNRPLTYDGLQMRYKITAANGNVIVNTLNLSSSSRLVMQLGYITADEHAYVLHYWGYESKCGQKGTISIEVEVGSPNAMQLFYIPQMEWFNSSECPNGVADQVFPTLDDAAYLTLAKQ